MPRGSGAPANLETIDDKIAAASWDMVSTPGDAADARRPATRNLLGRHRFRTGTAVRGAGRAAFLVAGELRTVFAAAATRGARAVTGFGCSSLLLAAPSTRLGAATWGNWHSKISPA